MTPSTRHDEKTSGLLANDGGTTCFVASPTTTDGEEGLESMSLLRLSADLIHRKNPQCQDDEVVEGGSAAVGEEEVSFARFFLKSKGPPQVVVLCVILALALGSTVGVIPAVMTDRYARLNHGYEGPDCSVYTTNDKPIECRQGSEDAQNMSATASFVSNSLTFITSAMVGSISDRKGRRGILILGMFLSLLPPAALVFTMLDKTTNPAMYYVPQFFTGIVNWMAVAISALSDVMPNKWRAPSFGLLLAGFSLGFALSPVFAIFLSHTEITIASFGLLLVTFILTCFFFPETLPEDIRISCSESYQSPPSVRAALLLPMKELSILNRNSIFRLLAALAFFSGIVSAADQSLLIYYAEDQLDFDDTDVAKMFGMMGILGMFAQGVMLKPLNDCIGEKMVLVIAFVFGAVSNLFYGLAQTKAVLFTGMALATITHLSFPTISAIKSNNVDECEQGRIQGALYSVSSLASAVGPASLRVVYHLTIGTDFPGAMFVFASFLFVIATGFAIALPSDAADSRRRQRETGEGKASKKYSRLSTVSTMDVSISSETTSDGSFEYGTMDEVGPVVSIERDHD